MNEVDNPKVEYLNELIEYLDQSAYNLEQLIEKEEAGINLYAFVKGVEFPKGQAQSDSFIYVIDGEIVYTVGDMIFNLKKGQTITIPANATYHIMVKEKVKIMVVWFKNDKIIRKK